MCSGTPDSGDPPAQWSGRACRVCPRRLRGRAADLLAGERLEPQPAAQLPEGPVARRHVRVGVEGRGARRAGAGGRRRGGASPGRPCCCRWCRSAAGRFAATAGRGGRPRACARGRRSHRASPTSSAPSPRPWPSGLTTANGPKAGRPPQKCRLSSAVIPRPCGEMTRGISRVGAGPVPARHDHVGRPQPSVPRAVGEGHAAHEADVRVSSSPVVEVEGAETARTVLPRCLHGERAAAERCSKQAHDEAAVARSGGIALI